MDRRTRASLLAAALLALVAILGVQAATADPFPAGAEGEPYPGDTLITVQSYGWFDNNNGRAFVVNPDGEVTWEFDPPNSRVFDAEAVGEGRILVAVATQIPDGECPPEFRDTDRSSDHCLKNRVIEVDRDTGETVWNYSWYDAFIEWHEVHDADRLPSGETAIVDMGNDRAFTVNRDGEITWSWSAEEHLGPGSEFWETYVPEGAEDEYRKAGPESDWTHMNDIDRLADGNFQLSIRNFDVVVEVDPATGRIVGVVGRPGGHAIMNEQHNPNRLAGGTVLVADSENDRIVEIDAGTGEPVWSYAGTRTRLQWPRDADRLPNGNTLVVDSRNFRVLEVNGTGAVVWSYSMVEERGIAYDADRLGLPEEPSDVPTGRSLDDSDLPANSPLRRAASWARFVLPGWVAVPELLTILAAVAVAAGLLVDVALLVRERRRA